MFYIFFSFAFVQFLLSIINQLAIIMYLFDFVVFTHMIAIILNFYMYKLQKSFLKFYK